MDNRGSQSRGRLWRRSRERTFRYPGRKYYRHAEIRPREKPEAPRIRKTEIDSKNRKFEKSKVIVYKDSKNKIKDSSSRGNPGAETSCPPVPV